MRSRFTAGLPLLGLLVAGMPGTGAAKVVKLPEAKPVVAFDVPDDWTLTPVATGLEISAPDHTSVVLTGLVERSRNNIAAWQKGATQRMVQFGVKFDPKAKAPPRTPHATAGHAMKSDAASAAEILLGEGSQLTDRGSALPSLSLAPSLSQSDASPATAPGQAASKEPPRPPQAKPAEAGAAGAKAADAKPADAKAADAKAAGPGTADFSVSDVKPADMASNRPRFSSAVLYGATLAGKPVDVEFLNFVAGNTTAFLMQQESSSTDARAAAIVRSVRLVK